MSGDEYKRKGGSEGSLAVQRINGLAINRKSVFENSTVRSD
jgi:hypothetical protein